MDISAKVQVTKKETVHPRLLLILVSSDEVMLSWRGSELATESLTFYEGGRRVVVLRCVFETAWRGFGGVHRSTHDGVGMK